MEKTIREIINEYRSKLLHISDLQKEEAATILVELSVLYGNCIEEIRKRDQEYITKLLEILQTEKMSVAKAQILVQNTNEWTNREIARGTKEALLEMIRSLKLYVRSKGEEWEVSRNI